MVDYHVIDGATGMPADELNDLYNGLGADGWKLNQVIDLYQNRRRAIFVQAGAVVEYLVTDYATGQEMSEVEATLDSLGADGWLLAQIIPLKQNERRIILMRGPGTEGTQGPPGPPGPAGPSGVNAGRIFYYDPTDDADISGYKRLSEAPSTGPETTVAVNCSGTGDVLVGAFVSDPGSPGTSSYPAGTGYRRIFARTSGGSARLRLQVFTRALDGTEGITRDELSPEFTNTTIELIEWLVTLTTAYPIETSDRIVSKIYAQRVSGPATITVTIHFEGDKGSHIQTTISAGAVGPPGPPGPGIEDVPLDGVVYGRRNAAWTPDDVLDGGSF